MLPTPIITATLQDCEFLFDGVRQIWLTLPETFSYQAGQYIYLVLANGEERPYSIANAPDGHTLEFHIHYHPGDEDFTHTLFNELLAQRKIRLHGPYGGCTYHVPAQESWVLAAGGTGLAPCKAIIEAAIQAEKRGQRHTPMHLYWGARTREHLYLDDQLQQWKKQFSWFDYTPVLFDQQQLGPHYRYGMVHDAIRQDYPNLNSIFVYASGPAVMVFAAQENLLKHGLPENQFCSDYTETK